MIVVVVVAQNDLNKTLLPATLRANRVARKLAGKVKLAQ